MILSVGASSFSEAVRTGAESYYSPLFLTC